MRRREWGAILPLLFLIQACLAFNFRPSLSGASCPTSRRGATTVRGSSEEFDEPLPWSVGPEVKEAFPQLSSEQWEQLESLSELLIEWNSRINIVSRKDIQNVGPSHILPALGLATLLHSAPKGTTIIDVGTGGGFPGLPLAIACPHARLLLIDSVGKKIQAVTDMAQRLGLRNVQTRHGRVEQVSARFDYVVGRSVTAIPKFLDLVRSKLAVPPPATSSSPPSTATGEGGGMLVPPELGVLYISGIEMQEGNPEPATLVPVSTLLPGAYSGDKAVWYFRSVDLLAEDPQSRSSYDERGVFRPKGEGAEWRRRREGGEEEGEEEGGERSRRRSGSRGGYRGGGGGGSGGSGGGGGGPPRRRDGEGGGGRWDRRDGGRGPAGGRGGRTGGRGGGGGRPYNR